MTQPSSDREALIAQWRQQLDEYDNWQPGQPMKLSQDEAGMLSSCADELAALAPEPPRSATWQPIATAPKGGGADDVRDPAYVDPPRLLVALADGKLVVVYWDWYYAEGGNGYTDGKAWVETSSGEVLSHMGPDPAHWMPLPEPPK